MSSKSRGQIKHAVRLEQLLESLDTLGPARGLHFCDYSIPGAIFGRGCSRPLPSPTPLTPTAPHWRRPACPQISPLVGNSSTPWRIGCPWCPWGLQQVHAHHGSAYDGPNHCGMLHSRVTLRHLKAWVLRICHPRKHFVVVLLC